MRGCKTSASASRQTSNVKQTPHPSGFAVHLLPQGEKEKRTGFDNPRLRRLSCFRQQGS